MSHTNSVPPQPSSSNLEGINGDRTPTKTLIYETLLLFLKAVCSARNDYETWTLQTTLDGYMLSMASQNVVDAIVESLRDRQTLMQFSTELGVANDPGLRAALRADEERIAALLVCILSSRCDEEAVLSLQGDSAQHFLDVVQGTLGNGFFLVKEHDRMARRIIRKLSEACDTLPSSFFIAEVSEREEHPRFGGGFGDIYYASHGNSPVALKRMRQFLRGSDVRRLRIKFYREALVWKDLHHPHILSFLGIDKHSFPSGICMVSPWMENGTVMDYLKTHGHTTVDKLLYEIAQGLQYLHSRHIVHGDLRGANILIKEDCTACLADFGLSMFSNATSTRSTNRRGSLYWMAPELIDPDRFGCKFARTPATDVYAFGCVCFELYTGRPPFSHLPEPAALMKIIDGERPPRPSGPPTMANRLWQHVTEFWAEKHSTRPLSRFVVQKMRWPPESQTLRPLPLLPDTSLSRSPSPTTSATLPSSPTPSTILPDVSSPESLVLDQGLGVFDDVITPEEDLRRLFNDCMIGARNATVLGEALLVATPEQLNDSLIVEFYKKCIDSQEVISTQIQWATATAERSPFAADEPPSEAPLALTPGATFELTREEALLAELLAANEQLTETLKLYDDLERVAFEHLVEQRGRQDLRMNSRQRQYTTTAVTSQGGSPSPILPPSPAGSNSRSRDVTRDSFLDPSTPLTPAPPYVGWVAAAPALLQEFIDESVNPREFYYDLREIAHSQSGSVLAAALVPDAAIHRLELPPLLKARDTEAIAKGKRVLVALKCIALLPESSTRLFVLRRECELLRGLRCEQVLGIDALYVDLVEDALWIRMELMERSLTDMISLIKEGLRLQDPRIVARLMSDILHALDYLQRHSIAHRDLRPDNLLLNSEGVLKVAHFSSAMRVTPEERLATDIVGIVHWQAPEVRCGSYDPLKIDVWSVGAILWQIAEVTPPFSDGKRPVERWPPVSKVYPPWLHAFLRLCSEPALSRPSPKELLETALVKRASGRSLITRLFSCFSSPEATHEPVAI